MTKDEKKSTRLKLMDLVIAQERKFMPCGECWRCMDIKEKFCFS